MMRLGVTPVLERWFKKSSVRASAAQQGVRYCSRDEVLSPEGSFEKKSSICSEDTNLFYGDLLQIGNIERSTSAALKGMIDRKTEELITLNGGLAQKGFVADK